MMGNGSLLRGFWARELGGSSGRHALLVRTSRRRLDLACPPGSKIEVTPRSRIPSWFKNRGDLSIAHAHLVQNRGDASISHALLFKIEVALRSGMPRWLGNGSGASFPESFSASEPGQRLDRQVRSGRRICRSIVWAGARGWSAGERRGGEHARLFVSGPKRLAWCAAAPRSGAARAAGTAELAEWALFYADLALRVPGWRPPPNPRSHAPSRASAAVGRGTEL